MARDDRFEMSTGSPQESSQDLEAVKRMRDKDVLFALVLIACSASVIAYALAISFQAMEAVNAAFYTAPGFFVLVVGITLMLLSVSLLVTALRQGGSLRWLTPTSAARWWKSKRSREAVLVFGYLYLYMCLCWSRIPVLGIPLPFWLSTFVFLCLMTFTFHRRNIPLLVLVNVAATALIYITFRMLVGVPLP